MNGSSRTGPSPIVPKLAEIGTGSALPEYRERG